MRPTGELPSNAGAKAWLPADVPARLGAYQLLRPLGQGGMGMVFEASHLLLRQRVAVKVLRPPLAGEDRFARRFRREIEALGAVQDTTHLVRATYAGEENGVLYLAMEYVDGADFDAILVRRGPLPVALACEAMRQAALGLEAVRAAGLVHRDVKPSNLMLTYDGIVKVLDLGLARLREDDELAGDELTPSDCMLGTFDYQAPEQASSARDVDIRADIYSLGCTLYKLLIGRAPFGDRRTPAQKLDAHARTAFPALSHDMPGPLTGVLARMVAKDPEERFATPGELAEALRPLAAGAVLTHLFDATADQPKRSAHDASTADATRDRTRQPQAASAVPRRWMPAVTAVVLLVALATLSALWFFRDGSEVPNDLGQPALSVAKPVEPAPQPTAADASANVAPRALDNLPAYELHDLLKHKPVPALWNLADGTAFYHYDDRQAQLLVRSPREGFFHLGRTTRPAFTFQVAISQTTWAGGTGIYLGYRDRATPAPGSPLAAFQCLLFGSHPGQNGTVYHVTRGTGDVIQLPGQRGVNMLSWQAEDIPTPVGQQVLAVSVENHRVSDVRLNGIPLRKLCRPDVEPLAATVGCAGSLGTINMHSDAVFRDAYFRILHPSPHPKEK